ncbi:MAG: TonB-dependent receptor plug domain-containing protein [Methylobacter sp.]|uniref:TonB-dependent receptor n=1 Tax=Methylobacter sp. TaxID=2051955 RepID=UPI0025F94401|nr:TonB-dependent receptor [Methylobacter sp.]MCK9619635.1 TonB-dependent receptor plug domain-containing protein [Methylobacter sp.]
MDRYLHCPIHRDYAGTIAQRILVQKFIVSSVLLAGFVPAHASQALSADNAEAVLLDTVEVKGRASHSSAVATSASQGVVGQAKLAYRPLARAGELVEVVPGALATQHSGSGKANQFYLRGFNLDHGTDFSVALDGVPMNMPSHAHGQGYLDLNSVIPELVDHVDYGKGPYYADAGDFSSAGYSRMHTLHDLPKGLFKFTGGELGYYRALLADSKKIGSGDLLAAGEFNAYDGVWQQPEDLGKYNGMLRYTLDNTDWGLSVNAKAYHSSWNATNQIPERAIESGTLDLYGSMDPSDGGDSNRYSLSSNVWSRGESYKNDFNAYVVYYDLNLYSNPTGFLDNLVQGDQVHQTERRVVTGGNGEQTWFGKWFGFNVDNSLGLQIRHDEVIGAALNRTEQRRIFETVRKDDISETSVAAYLKNQIRWHEKFRTISGLRADFLDINVESRTLAANSGQRNAALLSPKLSMIFGPWVDNEVFVNLGYGHHSNDARGATLRVNPVSGDSADSVSPLVRSRGGEIGLRNSFFPGLNSTVALWWMQVNSELIFVGDASSTEPSGRSERHGVEWSNYYQATDWLTLDADLAFSKANYVGVPRETNYIPNSVGRVISAGAVVQLPFHTFSTLRLRHFGDIPLNDAGSLTAGDTTLVNWGLGYQHKDLKLELDLFNLLDAKSNDTAYAYTSRLPGEAAAGVDGILKHPVEPRMVRLAASVRF